MATYRKKLLDKDGNTIIPAMAGDETGWVNTADLADGAVSTPKIADGAVTSGKIDWTAITATLDALSFIRRRFVYDGDCDDITEPGFYGFYNVTANNPGDGVYFAMLVFLYADARLGQLAFCMNDNSDFYIKARVRYWNPSISDTEWTTWKTISMS